MTNRTKYILCYNVAYKTMCLPTYNCKIKHEETWNNLNNV